MTRSLTAGPDAGPEPPFPIKLSGRVIKGFGRGSRELGIPTANIPITGLDIGGHTDIESGVYYGWAGLCRETATDDPNASPEALKQGTGSSIKAKVGHAAGAVVDTLIGSSKDPYAATEHRRSRDGRIVEVYPMVVSIGWNPYYKNEARSVEIHIIHKFDTDFYDSLLNISITGFIRKEQDYESLQALIDDIKTDIEVGGRSLERKPYAALANDQFLLNFDWAKDAAKLS